MIGAIAGDIIGSVNEFFGSSHFLSKTAGSRTTPFVPLRLPTACSGSDYVDTFRAYARKYPNRCYGAGFWHWVESGSREPYNSWGNGSAMRVSSVAFAFSTLEEVLGASKQSAEVTHNHPEGIRGAQEAEVATFLARQHASGGDGRRRK